MLLTNFFSEKEVSKFLMFFVFNNHCFWKSIFMPKHYTENNSFYWHALLGDLKDSPLSQYTPHLHSDVAQLNNKICFTILGAILLFKQWDLQSELVPFTCTDHQKQLCVYTKGTEEKSVNTLRVTLQRKASEKEVRCKGKRKGRKERKDKSLNPFTS